MNTTKSNQRGSPQKQYFSNDYISSCALYLIDGKQYTSAHLFLNEKIKEIRSHDDEQIPLTYHEMCDWVKRLIEIYETTED